MLPPQIAHIFVKINDYFGACVVFVTQKLWKLYAHMSGQLAMN